MDRIDEIALVLANSHDPEQIAEFLRSILTDSEVKEVSDRKSVV